MNKEFRVGVFAFICVFLLYFGFNFLKGVDFLTPTHTYYAVYEEVTGLLPSQPVRINGLQVGLVREISILTEQENKMLVTLEVNEDIVLPENTIADLADDGLLGGKAVFLRLGKGAPMKTGDTLKSESQLGLTESLISKSDPLIANLNKMMLGLDTLLLEFKGIGGKVNKVLDNTAALTGETGALVSENRAALRQTMANVKDLSASLAETERQLKPILGNVKNLTDSLKVANLAATVNNANLAVLELKKTLEAINAAEGTAGKLVKSDSLHTHLLQITEHLDDVLVDFKEHPKRYVHFSVFGKKDKQPKEKK